MAVPRSTIGDTDAIIDPMAESNANTDRPTGGSRPRAGGPGQDLASDSPRLTAVSVSGFKSMRENVTVGVRPLTVLAGPNNSGKSSIMQPLLLLKQTLDAPYDAGPLLLDGPHVRFSRASEVLWKGKPKVENLVVGLEVTNMGSPTQVLTTFSQSRKVAGGGGFELAGMRVRRGEQTATFAAGMSTQTALAEVLRLQGPTSVWAGFIAAIGTAIATGGTQDVVRRSKCFLTISSGGWSPGTPDFTMDLVQASTIHAIQSIVHIPAMRALPTRVHRAGAATAPFAGPFDTYTASVVELWQRNQNARLQRVSEQLARLGLTWKVGAARQGDTQIELNVGRLLRATPGGGRDVVSLADSGVGLSQVLPVLVGLEVAQPGQLVYLEEPEIHLHPRAQYELGAVVVEAVSRGVQVVVETHSSLLLRRIQTEIALGGMPLASVGLNWFSRNADGSTKITEALLTEDGGFGEWPSDFEDVSLRADQQFLDATFGDQYPGDS